MQPILTLEDLTKQEIDQNIYGEKAVGLSILSKHLPDNIQKIPVQIPALFAIPTNYKLNSKEVKEAYHNLTKDFKDYKIILARSSHTHELPGQFETHSSLFDPKDREKSWDNWLRAANRVINSYNVKNNIGDMAVIGQVLASKLRNKETDFLERKSEKFFGAECTGFVINSTNIITGHHPNLVSVHGLPSKIVRGDTDIHVIQADKHRNDSFMLEVNYKSASQHFSFQDFADVIRLSSPEEITTVNTHKTFSKSGVYFPSSVSDMDGIVPYDTDWIIDDELKIFSPTFLLEYAKELADKLDAEVELEGMVEHDEAINFFQLRTYETPKKNFEGLTKTKKNILFKGEDSSNLGFNQFKGNLYISSELDKIPKDGIFWYTTPIDNFNPEEFKEYKRVILEVPVIPSRSYNVWSHKFGRSAQILTKLDKIGVEAIIIANSEKIPFLSDFNTIQKNPILRKYYDITVECDGFEFQIYRN
ncbi:MAG: hypothetical protein ABH828_06495 [archaeon]